MNIFVISHDIGIKVTLKLTVFMNSFIQINKEKRPTTQKLWMTRKRKSKWLVNISNEENENSKIILHTH